MSNERKFKKGSAEEVEATMGIHQAIKDAPASGAPEGAQEVTQTVMDPTVSAAQAAAQDAPKATEAPKPQATGATFDDVLQGAPVAPKPQPRKFTQVPPTERRFAYGFAPKMEQEGECLDFTVDRIVTEEQAEASDPKAPLFEGLYVTEDVTERRLIVSGHFQLMDYFTKRTPEELAANVYRITFLGKVATKRGEVARWDIATSPK
jgi:hypothetical protein